MDKLLITIAMS